MKYWMWPLQLAAVIGITIILLVCWLLMLCIDLFRAPRCMECEHAEYGL